MSTWLWGDLHRQTALTCGAGTITDHLRAASQLGLDFLSITDNATLAEDPRRRQFASERLMAHRHFLPALTAHSISTTDWLQLQQESEDHADALPFLFLGYEWCSARYGDRNVYYLETEGPLALPRELEDLYRAAPETKRLLVAHHPGYARGRRGVFWEHHSPRLERLVEIFSTHHGSSEGLEGDTFQPLFSRSMGGLDPGSSVQQALLRGHKIGFVAGSDAHEVIQTHGPGKVGVLVDELSKQAIWDKLWARETVATTGPRLPFWLQVDQYGPGAIVSMDTLPQIRITPPPADWLSIQLVRNGKVVHTWRPVDQQGNSSLAWQETSEGLIPDNYYYARAGLPDDHRLWTSPVWISYLPDVAFARDILYWLPEERLAVWGRHSSQTAAVTLDGSVLLAEARDIVVETLGPRGEISEQKAVGSLSPGAQTVAHITRRQGERIRVRYTDVHDNVRIVQRQDLLSSDQMMPWQHADRRS